MNNQRTTRSSQKGAALLVFVIFFTIAATSLVLILARGVYSDVLSANILAGSKQSYYLADSFGENIAYRLIAGMAPDASEAISLFGAEATTTASFNSLTNTYTIATESDLQDHFRSTEIELLVGAGVSFNFGVQTGNGGFEMANSAAVIGNVFSNGSIEGAGSSIVKGDAISAGPSGFIDGIHATGSAWADRIESGWIEGNAYVDTINPVTTVDGLTFTGEPNEATTSLPLPDSVIDAHKASVTEAIAAGLGTLISSTSTECGGGTYTIDSDTTLSGPYKIECNVVFDKNGTDVTLTDTVWVEGNFDVRLATVHAGPATTTDSVLVIVDNPSNRLTSSQIVLDGAEFRATTSPKSYVVLVSMNEDAESGGTETAIDIGNNTGKNYDDFLAYAGHGKITLANQIHLKEITAYQIVMGQNTTVTYESGLLNLNFTSGPGGGFEISSWQEVE